MKKITNLLLVASAAICAASCSLFELDNYDAPAETLFGKVTDAAGNPVLTDQGSEGIRVRLTETSWEGNVTPLDFYCRPDGTFNNTKVFEGDYNIRIDGPFIPLVRSTQDGTMLSDESKNAHVKGQTEVNFIVEPFLHVELVGIPQAAGGKITANVKVTRGVSKEDFRSKVEPMGNYSLSCAGRPLVFFDRICGRILRGSARYRGEHLFQGGHSFRPQGVRAGRRAHQLRHGGEPPLELFRAYRSLSPLI